MPSALSCLRRVCSGGSVLYHRETAFRASLEEFRKSLPALAAAALSQSLSLTSCLELETRKAMSLTAFLKNAKL